MRRPKFQKLLLATTWTLVGFVALGEFLNAVVNARTLITFRIALLGTGIGVTLWIAIELIARYRGIPWRARGGQTQRIRGWGPSLRFAFLGAMLLLWTPSAGELARPVLTPIPKARPGMFTVAIALFDGDPSRATHDQIVASLQEIENLNGIDLMRIPRRISIRQGTHPDESLRAGRELAQKYLKQSEADLLLWGECFSQNLVRLVITSAIREEVRSFQLPPSLILPDLVIEPIKSTLNATILTQYSSLEDDGRFVADRLARFVQELEAFLNEQTDSDANELAPLRFVHANALSTIGFQTGQSEPLASAVAEYRTVLNLWTRDTEPTKWATTTASLASALARLGELSEDSRFLEEAVLKYQEMLAGCPFDSLPVECAERKSFLGAARARLANLEKDPDMIEQAVEELREARDGFLPEQAPVKWAMIVNNLCAALWYRAELNGQPSLLEDQIATYQEAIEVLPREQAPLHWAMLMRGLGTTLLVLGQNNPGNDGTEYLDKAVAIFTQALEEVGPQRYPLEWAMATSNLGTAQARLAERTGNESGLVAAVEALLLAWDFLQVNHPNRAFVPAKELRRTLDNASSAILDSLPKQARDTLDRFLESQG